MTFATWLTFFIASIFLCFAPGPGALSSMSAGMKYGWRRGMWNCIGMQVSIMLSVAIIALGLGAVLMASNTAFEIMKWCGALYLVWLGIQKFREEPVPFGLFVTGTGNPDTFLNVWKGFRWFIKKKQGFRYIYQALLDKNRLLNRTAPGQHFPLTIQNGFPIFLSHPFITLMTKHDNVKKAVTSIFVEMDCFIQVFLFLLRLAR